MSKVVWKIFVFVTFHILSEDLFLVHSSAKIQYA